MKNLSISLLLGVAVFSSVQANKGGSQIAHSKEEFNNLLLDLVKTGNNPEKLPTAQTPDKKIMVVGVGSVTVAIDKEKFKKSNDIQKSSVTLEKAYDNETYAHAKGRPNSKVTALSINENNQVVQKRADGKTYLWKEDIRDVVSPSAARYAFNIVKGGIDTPEVINS